MSTNWISKRAVEWTDIYMDLENQGKRGFGFKLTPEEEMEAVREAKKGNKDARTILWLSKVNAIDYFADKISTGRNVKKLIDEEDEYRFNCATNFLATIKNYNAESDTSYTTYAIEAYKNTIKNTLRNYEVFNKDCKLNEISIDSDISHDCDNNFTFLNTVQEADPHMIQKQEDDAYLIEKYFAFLPLKTIQILKLNMAGYKYIEIAKMLGITKQGISAYINDGQKFMRRLKHYAYLIGKRKLMGATFNELSKELRLSKEHVKYYYLAYLYLEDKSNEIPEKPVGIYNPEKWGSHNKNKLKKEMVE